MDSTILLFLLQDGVTNGAIYALLALALVLVFAVTRVILVPQGEFVTYGALTLAVLDLGKVPGTVGLLVVFAALALAVEVWASRKRLSLKLAGRLALFYVLPPLVIAALAWWLAPLQLGPLPQALLAIAIVAPHGPLPLPHRLPAAVGSLRPGAADRGRRRALLDDRPLPAVLRPGRLRAPSPWSPRSFTAGPLPVSGQSIAIYLAALGLMLALYVFFDRTILGKALRATAVNRLGARLVGMRDRAVRPARLPDRGAPSARSRAC